MKPMNEGRNLKEGKDREHIERRNLCTHKLKASLETEEINYKGKPNTA